MAWFAQQARLPQSIAFTHPEGARTCCQAFTDEAAGIFGLAHGHGQGPAAEVAAIAALRPCSRAGRFEETSAHALVELAAAEVHLLRSSQRVYAGMSSSLALALVRPTVVELALVGDCVAYVLDHACDRWVPVLSGAPAWLGPVANIEPAAASIAVGPGLRLLLATGQVLPILAASPRPAPAPHAIAELSVHCDEGRGFGLVSVDLSAFST